MTRTLHRSLLLGLVLAGLTPVWVRPEVDPVTGLPLGVAPATPSTAPGGHPDARAVFLGDPSYVGTVGDWPAWPTVAHEHGVPLVVDAAWAAHLGFHPALPPHALAARRRRHGDQRAQDAARLEQAALVLARTERHRPGPARPGVEATATTSPAGAILASIDAARALLERDGEALLGAAARAVGDAREASPATSTASRPRRPGVDPTKLASSCAGTGADGNAVEQACSPPGCRSRSPTATPSSPIVTIADTTHVGRLVDGWSARAVERHRGPAPRASRPSVVDGRPGDGRRRARRSSPPPRRSTRARRSGGSAPSSSRPTRRASRCSRPAS